MAKYVYAVFSNPTDGMEEEFNDWYTKQHLRDVLGLKGIIAAQRFRLAAVQTPDQATPYRYFAIYEIETDDLQSVASALVTTAFTDAMPISEALDLNSTDAWIFSPVTERVTMANFT